MRNIKFEELKNYNYWVTSFEFKLDYDIDDFAEDYFSDNFAKIDTKLFLQRLRDKKIDSIFNDNGLYKEIPLGTKCAFLNTISDLYEYGTSENFVWINDKGLDFLKNLDLQNKDS